MLTGCAAFNQPSNQVINPPILLTSDIDQSMPFLAKAEPKPFGSYLMQNIFYPPFEDARKQVEQQLNITLQNRGEAHITIVTPPEFDQVLKNRLTMEEINQIASDMKIQNTPFKAVCVGRGQLGEDQTYFVVVRSRQLFLIRQAIYKRYVANGGDRADWDPNRFYPHITLGYTKRDLHLEDGVIKDESSCQWPIQQM